MRAFGHARRRRRCCPRASQATSARPVELIAGAAGAGRRPPRPPRRARPRVGRRHSNGDRFGLAAQDHQHAAVGIELDHLARIPRRRPRCCPADRRAPRARRGSRTCPGRSRARTCRSGRTGTAASRRARTGASCPDRPSDCRFACRRTVARSSWSRPRPPRRGRCRPASSGDSAPNRTRSPEPTVRAYCGRSRQRRAASATIMRCTIDRTYRRLLSCADCGCSMIFCTRHAVISETNSSFGIPAVDLVDRAELVRAACRPCRTCR